MQQWQTRRRCRQARSRGRGAGPTGPKTNRVFSSKKTRNALRTPPIDYISSFSLNSTSLFFFLPGRLLGGVHVRRAVPHARLREPPDAAARTPRHDRCETEAHEAQRVGRREARRVRSLVSCVLCSRLTCRSLWSLCRSLLRRSAPSPSHRSCQADNRHDTRHRRSTHVTLLHK